MNKFLRLMIIFVFAWSLFGTTIPVQAKSPVIVLDVRTRVSLRAAQLAVKSMPGEYSWDEYRSCSSFVSAYLRQLSFPVNGTENQYAKYKDPFPWSGVINQVGWIVRNAPDNYHEAPLIDFLNQKLWNVIKPGSLVYLQKAEGHNGYNTFYHVVVLVGYRDDGSPQFAEISAGNKASFERNFEDVTGFYHNNGGGWDVNPYPTGASEKTVLKVAWFDPLAYLNSGLWLKSGVVLPNSQKLAENFKTVITVNIHDGTTAIFERAENKTDWKQVTVGGRNEFFAVTGRFLPANKTIGDTFFTSHKNNLYDSDYGVYISENGVFQNTWTPQIIAKVDSFQYVSGFGGLSGATDTAIMMPLVYDKNHKLVDASDYSPFTIHRIPDVANQDMLLRKDLLVKANDVSGNDFGPIPSPKGNLSSGCVNYDKETWSIIKGYLIERLDDGVGVVLSFPDFDQNLIFGTDLFKNPFIGSMFNKWCSETGEVKCDPLDRRNFRKTYLVQK